MSNRRRRRRAHAHAHIDSREPVVTLEPERPVVALAVSVEPAPAHQEPIDRFRYARELENRGDIAGATNAYQKLLLEEPDNIRARNYLGCLFDRIGLHLRALEQYEAAHALAPDNIEITLNLGDALVALGR